MKPILAGAALLAALLAGPALAQTEVSEVLIQADDTVILRVEVFGDLGPRSVVVSDNIPGVNCGAEAYRYTEHENRQCWVWVRKREAVLLGAKGMTGQVGKDWSVAWSGCEVLDGGATCRVVPKDETTVGAIFTGQPQ